MLKVYGSDLCKDCRALKKHLAYYKLPYEYIDINASIKNLAHFLKLRDNNPIYNGAKASGKIGIPTLCLENNTLTLDWETYLKEKGYELLEIETNACDLNGKSC